MVKIKKITHHDYTTIVDYVGGEGQLVICTSGGQNHATRMIVVRISVDFGGEIVFDGEGKGYLDDPMSEASLKLRSVLINYIQNELPGTDQEHASDVMEEIRKHNSYVSSSIRPDEVK